jgi:hypothetical protein
MYKYLYYSDIYEAFSLNVAYTQQPTLLQIDYLALVTCTQKLDDNAMENKP